MTLEATLVEICCCANLEQFKRSEEATVLLKWSSSSLIIALLNSSVWFSTYSVISGSIVSVRFSFRNKRLTIAWPRITKFFRIPRSSRDIWGFSSHQYRQWCLSVKQIFPSDRADWSNRSMKDISNFLLKYMDQS